MLSINDLFWWFKNPDQKDTWQKMFRWKFLKALRIFILFIYLFIFFFFWKKMFDRVLNILLMFSAIFKWSARKYKSLNSGIFESITAWKVSIFNFFSSPYHSECGRIQTRKIPNTDTFYAVYLLILVPISLKSLPKLNNWWPINKQFIFS